jgi:hypothetical protein
MEKQQDITAQLRNVRHRIFTCNSKYSAWEFRIFRWWPVSLNNRPSHAGYTRNCALGLAMHVPISPLSLNSYEARNAVIEWSELVTEIILADLFHYGPRVISLLAYVSS